VLIFILSLSQSSGLASHPLSATLLGWAWGRIWKKDELCMFAERRVILLSAPLQSIRWARKACAKPKSTNARWAVHSHAKRASTNKATYLSLKSDFGEEFWAILEAFACLEISREGKVQVPRILAIFSKSFYMWEILEREGSESREFWKILLCEDLQRTELEEEVVLRAWDEFVSDCEVLEVEETSPLLVFL